MSETPLSTQDQLDLESLGDTEGTQRSLLTIWKTILEDAAKNQAEPIPVSVAHRIVSSWPFLTFQETGIYHELYHEILVEMGAILRDHITEHPGATDFTGEDDARENHAIYRALLVDWHMLLDRHEADWRAEHPQSHIQVAVIADTRAFIFAQTGLAGHLDAIGFSLSNGEFLDALREAQEEVQGE